MQIFSHMDIIKEKLFELQDIGYRDFTAKLIPNIDKETIIGVRTPILRTYVKQISKEPYADEFLKELPHKYYEENNIHGALLCNRYKDIDELLLALDEFLPYVDNWATCDCLSPKLFKKHPDKVYARVKEWIKSDYTYVRRFAIGTLMGFFLEDEFRDEHLEMVCNSTNDEYYVNMMVAWYFSIALVKQYDSTIKLIEAKKLEPWTHNKSIQKAIESRRIDDQTKEYLRSLKVKNIKV